MGTQCWLRPCWMGARFPTEPEIVLFASTFRPAVGPTQPPIQIIRNVFPWAWSRQVLTLTANLYLFPRLIMLGAIFHLPILVGGVVPNFSTGTAWQFPDQWLAFVSPAFNAVATVKTDISWRSDLLLISYSTWTGCWSILCRSFTAPLIIVPLSAASWTDGSCRHGGAWNRARRGRR